MKKIQFKSPLKTATEFMKGYQKMSASDVNHSLRTDITFLQKLWKYGVVYMNNNCKFAFNKKENLESFRNLLCHYKIKGGFGIKYNAKKPGTFEIKNGLHCVNNIETTNLMLLQILRNNKNIFVQVGAKPNPMSGLTFEITVVRNKDQNPTTKNVVRHDNMDEMITALCANNDLSSVVQKYKENFVSKNQKVVAELDEEIKHIDETILKFQAKRLDLLMKREEAVGASHEKAMLSLIEIIKNNTK